MVILNRNILNIIEHSAKNLLLLGPRQTGKSTLLLSLTPDLSINLADEREYLSFARNPSELFERLAATNPKVVFLDEVQRIPSLLNSLQVIMDQKKSSIRFLLSGSSARKLKRGQSNLLPGRIISLQLGPLSSRELNYALDTNQALSTGTLPGIYTDPNPGDRMLVLDSYASTYVKEEIQAEALTRNIEGFSRFLFVAASRSTEFLDFTKIANTSGISRQSAIRFMEILEETLIVHRCEAFSKSQKKRLIQHPRFFFFDNGVLNALLGSYKLSEDRIGMLFENLLFTQLHHSAASLGKRISISTYRTEHGAEVDFIIELDGDVWAIEAKGSKNVGSEDFRGLKNFASFYKKPHRSVVAYLGVDHKVVGGVDVMPWQKLIQEMGL